jgi:hypothetical protein
VASSLPGNSRRGQRSSQPPTETFRNAANPFSERGRPPPRREPQPRKSCRWRCRHQPCAHSYLSLGAVIWAACGKDEGYTPPFLLDQTNRHSRFQESDLQGEHLARPVDLKELKVRWLAARERAEQLFERLPAEELGCLYLDRDNKPVTPDPDSPEFAELKRHFGSVRGAWPRIS